MHWNRPPTLYEQFPLVPPDPFAGIKKQEPFSFYPSPPQPPQSFSTPEFTWGVVKGVPQGVYESGANWVSFASDFVLHPIDTSSQLIEAITTLVALAATGEWNTLSKAIVPEVHKLIENWDTLSPEARGELAGYAFGKYGSDILLPGALAKLTAKGIKGTKALSEVYTSLQKAERTLALEYSGAGTALQDIKVAPRAVTLGEPVTTSAETIIYTKPWFIHQVSVIAGLSRQIYCVCRRQ